MGRGAERTITCMAPGCGYTYTHKRMDSKGWRRERMLHVTTGECARRIQEYNDRDLATRLQGGGVTMADVTESLLPIYALITQQADEVRELRERVERRLESRKKKKDYVERDSYPGPWPMNKAIDALSQFPDVCIVTKFREVMTKEYEHGWSWERAVGTGCSTSARRTRSCSCGTRRSGSSTRAGSSSGPSCSSSGASARS